MKKKKKNYGKENRKLIIISISLLFALIILASIIWAGVTPRDFKGLISKKVEYTNSSIVYFQEDQAYILSSRYKSDKMEFVYCLYGKNVKKGYLITSMEETKVESSDESSILYHKCPEANNLLGTIHSHPQPGDPRYIATCRLSKQDIYTFGSAKHPLTGVICGENDIAFYEPDDFDLSLKVGVIK